MNKIKSKTTKTMNYDEKFNKMASETMFSSLQPDLKKFIEKVSNKFHFTQQEIRIFTEKALDLSAWDGDDISQICPSLQSISDKKYFLSEVEKNFSHKKMNLEFKSTNLQKPIKAKKIRLKERNSQDKFLGQCPVASKKTVCCNLYTIDAVRNCGFGCNYCGIQTMFTEQDILFDPDFRKKLISTQLDPQRKYHFGTGQSSDALMWGNKHGILDACIEFAEKNPNVLLEFKTKSKNIKYFLEKDCPPNIVCSWSLNPNIFIENEEKLTANFEERIQAARLVADKGIKVAFHFHPIVIFKNWKDEYSKIFNYIQNNFDPKEILFISMGTITLPKPVIKKIRKSKIKTKVLQMPFLPNPEGKLSYPDSIKNDIFKFSYQSFSKWHDKVFFYLCMEEAKYWEAALGYVYNNNNEFEDALLNASFKKL